MTSDYIVLSFPLTDELKNRFNNALSEYEKFSNYMNEKLDEFNENFDQVYFLLYHKERLDIVSKIKSIMFDIRQCEKTINRIKSILNQSTITDNDLCLLYPNLEGQYTIFNCDIEQMTKLMNENA
jgi:hypothetical protein